MKPWMYWTITIFLLMLAGSGVQTAMATPILADKLGALIVMGVALYLAYVCVVRAVSQNTTETGEVPAGRGA